MKVIWKYEIPNYGVFELELPMHAQVLDVQMQGQNPVLWALVNTDMPLKKARFEVVGAGWPDLDGGLGYEGFPYIGTFQTGNGLVFHLFGGQTV